MRAIRIKDEKLVDKELADLGIPRSILVEAVISSYSAFQNTSPFAPVNAPGLNAWMAAVEVLREKLVDLGWRCSDKNNLPLIISPDGKIAIQVVRGDESTGSSTDPSTKRAPGTCMIHSLAYNYEQLTFDIEAPKQAVVKDSYVTWFLLIDRNENECCFELSLPYSEEGDEIAWKKRLHFEPIETDAIDLNLPTQEEPDIDVPIERKR